MRAKRMSKKQKKQQQVQTSEQHRPDPAVACFALHPSSEIIAVAVGQNVRINKVRGSSAADQIVQHHTAPVRAVSFQDSQFLTAGDDKTLKVWDTNTWEQTQAVQSAKKITAAIFSQDGKFVVFADKYGDVAIAKLQSSNTKEAECLAIPLLGHLCSIITSLAFSPDGSQLVSTDQDCKVRVSTMPTDLHKGAHSIQSICMGHKNFAKCCAFLTKKKGLKPLLLSSGGDSTIRSWDYLTGKQLDCFACATAVLENGHPDEAPLSSITTTSADGGVPAATAIGQSDAANQDLGDDEDADLDEVEPTGNAAKADEDTDANPEPGDAAVDDPDDGEMEDEPSNQGTEEQSIARDSSMPAVLSIAAAADGCTVAAAIEGRDAILMLHCDPHLGKLSQLQELQLPGVNLPTQVQFDAKDRLWAIGGPLPGSEHAVCLGVATCKSNRQWQPDDSVLPDDVKAALESREAGSNASQHASAATANQQVNQQLRKRVYTDAEREARKRNRNGVK